MQPKAILDRVDACIIAADGSTFPRRAAGDIDSILVHRIDPEEMAINLARPVDPSACGLAAAFCDASLGTGGRMPYTFVVHPDGLIEQALPLSCVSPHGRRWNKRAIGVACIGDFRRKAPSAPQYDSLTWLLRLLRGAYCPAPFVGFHGLMVPAIAGHTEVPQSTGDAAKVCPGRFLDMDQIRRDVDRETAEHARHALLESGLAI